LSTEPCHAFDRQGRWGFGRLFLIVHHQIFKHSVEALAATDGHVMVMNIFKKFYLFIILLIVEMLCWLLTTSPWHFLYESGPIDAQGKFFFICLVSIYFLVPFSIIYLAVFICINYKDFKSTVIALAFNLHLFAAFIYYKIIK